LQGSADQPIVNMYLELQLQTNDKQLHSVSSEMSQYILIYLIVSTTVQIMWCWSAGCSVCNELQWNECTTNWPRCNIGLCSRIRVKKYAEMCKTPIMTACLGLGSMKWQAQVLSTWQWSLVHMCYFCDLQINSQKAAMQVMGRYLCVYVDTPLTELRTIQNVGDRKRTNNADKIK
jgi:hypothetical protein